MIEGASLGETKESGAHSDTQARRRLPAISRIAAGILGVLTAMTTVIFAFMAIPGKAWWLTTCGVTAVIFLYAAWAGQSPLALEKPETIIQGIAKKYRRDGGS